MNAVSGPASTYFTPPAAWPVLDLLACPNCRGRLRGRDGDALVCSDCSHEWRERDGWLDFRPDSVVADSTWSGRQSEMEDWYDNLITASDLAGDCYRHDYEPLAGLLGELRGLVLDIGGGNGVTRQYLAPATDYVVVDPTAKWVSEDWLAVAADFPALREPIVFVLGVGEQLPFASGRLDSALSLFSINHASDPAAVISEAHRVLRPGGRFILVAEDVEPRWSDLARPGFREGWMPLRKAIRDKLAATLRRRPWPVAPDHVPTTEGDLREQLRGRFELRRRSWTAGYFTLDAVKV